MQQYAGANNGYGGGGYGNYSNNNGGGPTYGEMLNQFMGSGANQNNFGAYGGNYGNNMMNTGGAFANSSYSNKARMFDGYNTSMYQYNYDGLSSGPNNNNSFLSGVVDGKDAGRGKKSIVSKLRHVSHLWKRSSSTTKTVLATASIGLMILLFGSILVMWLKMKKRKKEEAKATAKANASVASAKESSRLGEQKLASSSSKNYIPTSSLSPTHQPHENNATQKSRTTNGAAATADANHSLESIIEKARIDFITNIGPVSQTDDVTISNQKKNIPSFLEYTKECLSAAQETADKIAMKVRSIKLSYTMSDHAELKSLWTTKATQMKHALGCLSGIKLYITSERMIQLSGLNIEYCCEKIRGNGDFCNNKVMYHSEQLGEKPIAQPAAAATSSPTIVNSNPAHQNASSSKISQPAPASDSPFGDSAEYVKKFLDAESSRRMPPPHSGAEGEEIFIK